MPASRLRSPRVAWVESPLQFVNAVEYAAQDGEPLRLLVRPGLVGLEAVVEDLTAHVPEHVTVEAVATGLGLARFVAARARLAGDAYSGQMRAALSVAGPRDLVIVDDGSMTLSLAGQLVRREALARPGQRESVLMAWLGGRVVSRIRRAAPRGNVTLFTAFDDHPSVAALESLGIKRVTNDFAWLRSVAIETPVKSDHVLLGSALVEDGFIDPDAYAAWVGVVAAGAVGGLDYLPHRREASAALARYAQLPGVRVVDVRLPAEVTLASTRHLTSVDMLPSTAAVTLRGLLPPAVRVRVSPVPDSWWTSRAEPKFRAMLTDLSGDSP